MSPPIKNVAVAGGSGNLGRPILKHLLACGKFNVKVLRRLGSPSQFPNVNVADVDYDSVADLTAALQDQDALVSTIGSLHLATQTKLVDASIAAAVKRFIPSEFGPDTGNPEVRKLPAYKVKVDVQDYVVSKAENPGFTYTLVTNNVWLDWGLQCDFILKLSDYKPVIIDGGDDVFSATTLDSIGEAVVGILTHPDETENRRVYLESAKISQNKLLRLAKKAAPEKPWEIQTARLDDMTARSDERMAQGIVDMETIKPYLLRSTMDPRCGPNFAKNDNELLGVTTCTDDDILELVKKYVK